MTTLVDAAPAKFEPAPDRNQAPGFDGFVTPLGDGLSHLDLAVDGISCAGCMRKIENGIGALPGVTLARVNMTEKRLAVEWTGSGVTPATLVNELAGLGFRAHPFDPGTRKNDRDTSLVKAMAVAGFAAMNIMLLSVSVWSGNVSDITPETRDLFHWISALIALPAVAYAGQPFFQSAMRALKAGTLNMDVPISLAVMLALVVSVMQTLRSAEHAYFDSAVMLLFFLLIGRWLDQTMRRRTRAHAETLLALKGDHAQRREPDGTLRTVPLSAIMAGDHLLVAPGERFPADGTVIEGRSAVDQSLVTGETDPAPIEAGSAVYAGALNQDGAVTMAVTAAGQGTLLDEINRLLERALAVKSKHVVIADRAARVYAPAVHLIAAGSFVGWLIAGMPVYGALLIAVAVLIITCPCALGLAVPAAQVVASGALFRSGVVINAGDMLERLGEIDTVVFDKTGTLTLPERQILNADQIPETVLNRAIALAKTSRHPLAQALARTDTANAIKPASGVIEVSGRGVWCDEDDREFRLGSPAFCGLDADAAAPERDPTASVICATDGAGRAYRIEIGQRLKEDAVETLTALKARGLDVIVLSGDRAAAVAPIADALGIDDWRAGLSPTDKIAVLEALKAEGRKVLMVGDGLNDAPALAAAHASLSPITAVHVSQAAADGLILNDRLTPIDTAIETARRARSVMRENIGLAIVYNVFAVPIAIAGFVTPLVAALAMSGSSIIVTVNSLRARARPSA